jgi:hypothetical protein
MNDREQIDIQMDVDDFKYDILDSNKKHPLSRVSLDLCPTRWALEDPDKTDNQYSLNVELDDADYLNIDPLEEQVQDFEMDEIVIPLKGYPRLIEKV